jgi:HSP20 family molecular chaperone IbpA
VSEHKHKDKHPEGFDQFDQLVTDLWHAQFGGRHRGAFCPAVDSYRTEDPAQLVVIVELPGIDPEHVQIVLHDRTLIIAGERIRPKTGGRRYHQMEIDHGPFERRIQVHEQVDAEAAGATYERGLLRVVLPIAKHPPGAIRVPIELRPKK